MSLYYTRGGFHAATRTINVANQTEFNAMAGHLMAQLIALFTASKKDATARGATYTKYWDFYGDFFDRCVQGYFSSPVRTYTAAELSGADASLLTELQAVAGIDGTAVIAVRANDDTADTHPAIATCLHGQEGELLYICFCAGAQAGYNTTTTTSYGLKAHAKWLHGYGTSANAAYIAKSGFHVWYNPQPTGMIYPFGAHHPGRDNFLNHGDGWLVDGSWTQLSSDVLPNATPSLRNSSEYKHIVTCKEGVVFFGYQTSGVTYTTWLVLGKKIVEGLDGVGYPGMFALQYVSNDGSTSALFMMSDMFGSAFPNDMRYGTISSHAGTTDQTVQKAVRFSLQPAMPCVCNRKANMPVPLSPICVHAFPSVSEQASSSSCILKGDGTSLIGYLRGDIARCTGGWGLTMNTTIDNGNYLVLHGAGTNSYSANYLTLGQRLVIGWDSSNEVVL